ncbi:hypothetical protein [Streptomyces sp. NRRL B-24484]|uniref:hypothetical protein n=1 Tax=Streptomyces sp. NRRL B-24484 TaxID=1463833 RepID=UPI0004C077F5|nr:hypothetical protein [Streptomyces sp. NRRL B-24484]
MNLRALTRGDAAVAGAAVLLFIASFLPYLTVEFCIANRCTSDSQNAWKASLFPILPSAFLLGIVAAALILVHRLQGEASATRQVLGLRLDQWGTALSVATLWSALWAIGGGGDGVSHGFGAWLGLLAALVLAGAAAAGPLVPALQGPLLTDKPAAPAQPYQAFPQGAGQPGQPGQYGYPQAGQPGAAQAPAYGAEQQQAGGYGYPGAAQQAAQPVHDAAPAAPFQPFWFAVPAVRQLANKDNPAAPPVGELVPGTWYLAVEQRGAALVAQLPDGSHGLLADASGIQRG